MYILLMKIKLKSKTFRTNFKIQMEKWVRSNNILSKNAFKIQT